jgi:DNA-binding transcriptional LysR family regulator
MDVLRLTLRQLQIFVAVARTGTTTAAGDEISLSQSATSAAVTELERLLSLRLFDRAGKRLLLNDNGRALLPRAQALLDGAYGLERTGKQSGPQLQSLRIGASTTIGTHVVPGLLSTFLEGQQHLAGDWRSGVAIANTAEICARVAAFDLDIGLIEGACHEPALQVHRWLRDEMVVVAAADPKAARRSAQRMDVKALREAVWLLREPGSGTREATDQALLPHLRSYRRSIELGSSEAIKYAAAAGLGLACLSRWVADDLLQAGRLREVATTLPPITRQCYWVVHREKHLTPTLQRLIERLGGM